MRILLVSAAAVLCLSIATAQAQTPSLSSPMPSNDQGNVDRTTPGTPLGTGTARGSDDKAAKPVPGPGATTGDSSGGVSSTAPQAPAGTSTGSAPPSSSDMDKAPKAQGHGGSSSGGISGGAVAPARRSGDNAPAGNTGTMSR